MSKKLPIQTQVSQNNNHLMIRNNSYRTVNTAQKQNRPEQQQYNVNTPLKQTKKFETLSLRKPSPLAHRNLRSISKNLQAQNYGEYLNNLNYITIKQKESDKLISLQIEEEQVYKQPKVIKHDLFEFGDDKQYQLETRSNDNSVLERKHQISRSVTLENNTSFQSSKIVEQNYLLREENHKNHIMMQQLIDIIEKQRQQDQQILQQRPQNRAISTHIPSFLMNEFANQNKRISQTDVEMRKSVLNFKKPSAYHVPNIQPEKRTESLTDISEIKHQKWDVLEDRLPSMDHIVPPFSRKSRQSNQTTTKSLQIQENKEMSLTFGKQDEKSKTIYFSRIQPVQFPREIFPQNVQKVKRYMSKLNQGKV